MAPLPHLDRRHAADISACARPPPPPHARGVPPPRRSDSGGSYEDEDETTVSSGSGSEDATSESESASGASEGVSGGSEDEDDASEESASGSDDVGDADDESGQSESLGSEDEDDEDEASSSDEAAVGDEAKSEASSGNSGTVSDGSGEEGASDSEEDSGASESSGNSIVPDLGGDEDDEFEPARKKGILEYFGLGGGKSATPPLSEAGSDEGDAYKYDFGDDAALPEDGTYDFPEDYDDEDEPLEEGLKDDQLEKRLEMAYAFTTRERGIMQFEEFRQAVAMMGKVFTKEETETFYKELVTFEGDPKALGNSTERDDRGLLKRNAIQSTRNLFADREHVSQKGFVSFFEKYLTRTVDPKEAAEHFRALVEGAAEMVLRGGDEADEGGETDAVVNDELMQMKDTKSPSPRVRRRPPGIFEPPRSLGTSPSPRSSSTPRTCARSWSPSPRSSRTRRPTSSSASASPSPSRAPATAASSASTSTSTSPCSRTTRSKFCAAPAPRT